MRDPIKETDPNIYVVKTHLTSPHGNFPEFYAIRCASNYLEK